MNKELKELLFNLIENNKFKPKYKKAVATSNGVEVTIEWVKDVYGEELILGFIDVKFTSNIDSLSMDYRLGFFFHPILFIKLRMYLNKVKRDFDTFKEKEKISKILINAKGE